VEKRDTHNRLKQTLCQPFLISHIADKLKNDLKKYRSSCKKIVNLDPAFGQLCVWLAANSKMARGHGRYFRIFYPTLAITNE
jgi:hypothetical protein